MIFLKIAWRNMFRNKRRTIITGIAIGLGLASLIFVDALMQGMKTNMVLAATSPLIGHGQIHAEGFRETSDIEKVINSSPEVIEGLKKEDIIKDFAPRVMSVAMISSPSDVSAIELIGIDPLLEKNVSEIDDVIVKGDYFEAGSQRSIVIGNKLAELLSVNIGDRIVVTAAQAYTGSLSQEMFYIDGIYSFEVKEMDSGFAFIRLDKAHQMLGLKENVHEIAFTFTDINFGQDENLPFWKKYSQKGNQAIGWTQVMPDLNAALSMTNFSIFIISIILFSIVALVIVNTLFMSLYERMFEFGVMRAVGTKPFNMMKMVIYEAFSLGIVSVVIGSFMGLLSIIITNFYGINYTGIEFAGITFRRLLYPILELKQFITYPIVIVCFNVLAALYPAVYAARMKAIEAMRKSL